MWRNSHSRQTQRGARRRNGLGVLACLLATLFTGVLLGRVTDDVEPTAHIYLNETAPPAAATARPVPTAAKKAQPYLDSIPRKATTTTVPRGKSTPKPTKTSEGQVSGFDSQDDPTQVFTDGREPAKVIAGLAARVVSLTNTARAEHGCRPLRVDSKLGRSAREHSLEMATSGMLAHNSPDGASPWDRMERAGYHWGAAENIGNGYSTPSEAVRGWLDSPDHRRNILDCSLKAIGVGVASGPDGPWWTQDFGTQ
jgi:uncharacterized protein YkwD